MMSHHGYRREPRLDDRDPGLPASVFGGRVMTLTLTECGRREIARSDPQHRPGVRR